MGLVENMSEVGTVGMIGLRKPLMVTYVAGIEEDIEKYKKLSL